MTGSTAFFAPLILTVPLNRLPPFITNRSKISILLSSNLLDAKGCAHDVIDYVVRVNLVVDFL